MAIVGGIVGLAFAAIGLFVAGLGARKIRDGVRIWRSEPVPIRELGSMGRTAEFEGTVRAISGDHTIEPPFAGEPAVLASYKVERRERSSSSRNSGSRSKWSTVDSGDLRCPFLVEDDTGVAEIDPTDATLSLGNEEVQTTESSALDDDVRLRLSVLTDEYDLDAVLPQATGSRRRFTEGHLSPGDPVHVYGTQVASTSPRSRSADVAVEDCEGDTVFQISAGDESAAVRRTIIGGVGLALFGLVFAGAGVFVLTTMI